MSLLDTLRNLLSDDDQDTDPVDEMARAAFDMDPPDPVYDWQRQRDLIEDHYDVTPEQADELTDAVLEGQQNGWGYKKTARKADDDSLDLDRETILTVVWTETMGIQTRTSVVRYAEREMQMSAEWMLPGDGDASPVCEEIATRIDDRGGFVPLGELQEVMRAAAEAHEDGTPARVDDWIPHERCRCTLSAVPGGN